MAHPQNFSELLQKRRGELGLTQAQAAGRIGVTPRGYRKWENGEVTIPRASQRVHIAEFLQMPFVELNALLTRADIEETEDRVLDRLSQLEKLIHQRFAGDEAAD